MTEQLSAALESIPVPPSRVTAEGVLRAAKSSARRRRRATIGAVAAATATALGVTAVAFGGQTPHPVALPPSASPSATSSASPSPPGVSGVWKIEQLPLPAGVDGHVSVTAIDPTGRFIGGFVDKETDQRAILWDNGVPAVIVPPARAQTFVLMAVNSSGMAVGSYSEWGKTGEQRAWQYHRGVLTMLPAPEGDSVLNVFGINSRGDIAGVSAPSVSSNRVRAVIWTAAQPRVARVLETLEERQFTSAINDAGFVSGNVKDVGGYPCVWEPNGTVRKLLTPSDHPYGRAAAINADWASGHVSTVDRKQMLPARWDLRTGELKTYQYPGAMAVAVADNGTVLLSTATNAAVPALIGADGTAIELPVPPDARLEQASPKVMNRDATVLAGGRFGYPPIIWRKT